VILDTLSCHTKLVHSVKPGDSTEAQGPVQRVSFSNLLRVFETEWTHRTLVSIKIKSKAKTIAS